MCLLMFSPSLTSTMPHVMTTLQAMEDQRTENWLYGGIIVKILNKKVGGGKFYKKKARVERVIDQYLGESSE